MPFNSTSDAKEPMRRTSRSSKGMASPFADEEVMIDSTRSRKRSPALWIGAGLVAVVVLAIIGFLIAGYLNNPYRTLEPFPVSKYLESHRALAGSRFKADLRVEADLGWKEGVGRLMLFTTESEPRPIAVLVPEAVGKDIYFTKGQIYRAELEVKEGGLIYANACRKI